MQSRYLVFQVFILGMSWYWAILLFVQITSKPYWLFQSSYQPKLTFWENFYKIFYICLWVHLNQFRCFHRVIIKVYPELYTPILIFSESYYPNIYVITTTDKWTIKIFAEILSNNINVFWELLSNNTDFFRDYVTQ